MFGSADTANSPAGGGCRVRKPQLRPGRRSSPYLNRLARGALWPEWRHLRACPTISRSPPATRTGSRAIAPAARYRLGRSSSSSELAGAPTWSRCLLGASRGLRGPTRRSTTRPPITPALPRISTPSGALWAHPGGALARDLKHDTLKRFSLIVPNLCNDEHDCPIPAAIAGSVLDPSVLASSASQVGGPSCSSPTTRGPAPTTASTPSPSTLNPTRHDIRTPLNHYSLLKTIQQLLDLPCLAHTCDTTTHSMLPSLHL